MMNGDAKYQEYTWQYRQDDFKFCPKCGSALSKEDLHIAKQPQLVCDHCKFIFYLDPKIVVTAVVHHCNKVLLLKRAEEPGKGKWGLPGGYVSRGVSILNAVSEEVEEEASLQFINRGILHYDDLPNAQGLIIVFWGNTNNPRPRPNIESSDARFFPVTALPPAHELAFATTLTALQIFKKMLASTCHGDRLRTPD